MDADETNVTNHNSTYGGALNNSNDTNDTNETNDTNGTIDTNIDFLKSILSVNNETNDTNHKIESNSRICSNGNPLN